MWFQKISIFPPQKGLEIPGRRGVLKGQIFKAMFEAKLEFPEGWGGGGGGGHSLNPFCGRYGYFLEPHIRHSVWYCSVDQLINGLITIDF